MNIWHGVREDRVKPEDFIAVIEIEKNSKNKYELDKETGRLILDRILHTSTHYPANYGFIPRTYSPDNDPLDVLVLCNEGIVPLSLVRCYPIGMVRMLDEGSEDNKIIAIPFSEPTWNCYRDIKELPRHMLTEIEHFFTVYKELENKHTAIIETVGREEALQTIAEDILAYRKRFCAKED